MPIQRKPEGYIDGQPLRPESLMQSYGYVPELSEGALKCPIFQTSTFVFKTAEEGKAFFELAYGLREPRPRESLGLIYSRLNNPDLEVLEDRLALWDDAESCAVFESGMAAISTALFALLAPGDLVVHSEPLYGGTDYFLKQVLHRFGIETLGFAAGAPPDELERQLVASGKTDRVRIVYIETPANPTNALVDIAAMCELAKRYGRADRRAIVAVDNTFLGPLWQHPLAHGADLVLYSATKYIGGHSDVIAGACMGSSALMQDIRAMRTFLGTMAGPWTGWLLMRSLETLKLRMTSQMKNARYVADFLADHPKVDRVYYLGHLDRQQPEHEIYRRQCLAPGGMVSFDLVGGEAEAFRFLNRLKLIKLAVSLGGTESLAEHPASMTHSDIPKADRARMGIGEAMVRLSIGVEHPEDINSDIARALEAV